MSQNSESVFGRMLAGGIIPPDDPGMPELWDIVTDTLSKIPALNASVTIDEIRARLSAIIGSEIDSSTVIFAPFYTNFGKHIRIGKNVFINHACTFLDLGGITVGDHTQIGPKVNLITENHPIDPTKRKSLVLKSFTIGKNVWIGAAATILPGVVVGDNAIVAAGAVVRDHVEANTIVGGIPARVLKQI